MRTTPLPMLRDVSKGMPRARGDGRVERSDLGLLVACAAGVALVVASTAFLVWVRTAQVEAGYAIQKLRHDDARLRHERSALDVEIASLLRPERLAHVARTQLGMQPADATTTVVLSGGKRTAMAAPGEAR